MQNWGSRDLLTDLGSCGNAVLIIRIDSDYVAQAIAFDANPVIVAALLRFALPYAIER
jgi:hypothetical protein